MPKASPEEFRREPAVVARRDEAPLTQIAQEFGAATAGLHRWLKIADEEDDPRARAVKDESVEPREARQRIRLPEREAEIMRRADAYPSWDVNPK